MKEKPILFSTSMVKAILDGTKTMTRRVVKNKVPIGNFDETVKYTKYHVGDVLWVRETWLKLVPEHFVGNYFVYKANADGDTEKIRNEYIKLGYPYKWKPSIIMPKEAARIFLKIKSIRIERLQNITPIDAACEGIQVDIPECLKGVNYPNDFDKYSERQKNDWCDLRARHDYMAKCEVNQNLLAAFKELWDSLNAKHGYSWDTNPWVWVYEFERINKE